MPYKKGFLGNTRIDELTGCWNYQADDSRGGYPSVRFMGKRMGAHRAAAICWLGFTEWRNPKMMVLHHCDNRCCINPKHIYIGSHMDNVSDMLKRKRQWNLRKTHCSRGHEFTSENTGINRLGQRWCRICRKAWRSLHKD